MRKLLWALNLKYWSRSHFKEHFKSITCCELKLWWLAQLNPKLLWLGIFNIDTQSAFELWSSGNKFQKHFNFTIFVTRQECFNFVKIKLKFVTFERFKQSWWFLQFWNPQDNLWSFCSNQFTVRTIWKFDQLSKTVYLHKQPYSYLEIIKFL